MTYIFRTLLVASLTPFLVSKAATAKKQGTPALDYIHKTYLCPKNSPKKEEPSFQHTYGDPLTSQVVLLVFTSVTCPVCAEFHTSVLPALAKDIQHNPKCAVIIRDYPADPLSLKASSIIWANGEKNALIVGNKLLDNRMKWIQESPEDSLKEILKIVNHSPLSQEEKKMAEKAPSNMSFLQSIFDRRNLDKKALDITQVPWAHLIVKHKKDTYPSEVIEIKDIRNLKEIQDLMREKSLSFSLGKDVKVVGHKY